MTSEILLHLARLPELLERVAAELTGAQARDHAGTAFAFVEHAWHLADLEREGYGTRITRLLAEDRPSLPDFPGDRIAAEREYLTGDVTLAVALFEHARRRNVERLGAMDAPTLDRSGVQDGAGEVSLARVPRMMLSHDSGHVTELIELLTALTPHSTGLAALRRHLADTPASDPGLTVAA
jgi:hypothetical protein